MSHWGPPQFGRKAYYEAMFTGYIVGGAIGIVLGYIIANLCR